MNSLQLATVVVKFFIDTKLQKKSYSFWKSEKFVFTLSKIFCEIQFIREVMVQKKRLMISYKNCSADVLQAIKEKYPLGYGDAIIKVEKPNGEFFHAITLDFEDISYLVKVDVKIDNLTEEEFEKQFGSAAGDGADGVDLEAKDDENQDNIASSDVNYDE